MRPALFILPFLAFFVGMIGTAVASAFPELAVLSKVGWALGAGLIALWVLWDLENTKRFFQRSGTKFGAGSGFVVLLGVTVIVGLGFLSNKPRFNKSIDITRSGINTLSDQSKKMIQNLNKDAAKISMAAFFQDDAVKDQFKGLVAMYVAAGGDFSIEYISTMEDPTRVLAEKLTAGNTVILSYKDQQTRISTFNEEKLTNAFLKLLKPNQKKVYFTKGHGEGKLKASDPDGFDVVIQQLENNRYLVEEFSLLERIGVPDDADLVIISGPKYDFKPQETALLESYLKKGGALLVLVDAVRDVKNISDLTRKFGIEINSDLLVLSEEDPRSSVFGRHFTLVNEFDEFSPVTKDFASQGQMEMLIPFVRSISEHSENEYSMKVSLAAKSSEYMEQITGVTKESDLANISPDRITVGSKAILAVAVGRAANPKLAASGDKTSTEVKSDTTSSEGMAPSNKEIRLVAVGSSHFARNQGAQTTASNRDLFLNITNYLLQDDDFISIRPKDMTKSTISLTSSSSQLMLTFISLIYPFLFLGFGVFFWLRRRNA